MFKTEFTILKCQVCLKIAVTTPNETKIKPNIAPYIQPLLFTIFPTTKPPRIKMKKEIKLKIKLMDEYCD
jgi:hypothetical protein